MEIVQNDKIRKFQNSGKVEPSFWDRLDNWVDAAEIPMAIGAAGATMTTAATGGLAVPTMILNIGSAGIDTYQALRNLYKGNYAQAGLDGAEMLASLLGTKITAKGLSAGYKTSEAATRAAKISKIPASKRARYIRSHPAPMSPAQAKVLGKIFAPIYGALSTISRKQDGRPGYVVQQDNTRVAQRRIHKKGGVIPDPTKERFTFKRNQIVKDAEQLNGKKDMRKKLVKSGVVTNKKRIRKGQEGLKFATYTPIETPVYRPEELENPFSEFNFPTQYQEIYENSPQIQEAVIEQEPVKQEIVKPKTVKQEVPKYTPKVTTKFGSRKDYVTTLYSHLYKALQENGIDAKTWAPILTAHTSIESAWGNEFSRKNNNFGGIKGKGSGKVKTKEYSPEKGYYTVNDSFKSYVSIDDFADDYVKMLKNKFGAFNGTPDQYLANIRKHGYFTARLEDYQKIFNSRLRTVNSLLNT